MKCWVDVAVGNKPAERHRLGAARTTLGTSSKAGISVAGVNDLLPEHFSLTPQIDGCWVELSEEAAEAFTCDGRPSRGALVPWGQDVYWGSLRLSLQAQGLNEQKNGTSPVVWGALVVVPFTLFSFLYEPEADHAAAASPLNAPPALFGSEATCSAEGPAALGRASVAEQTARAKHARAAYDVADGVEAVQLLREAAQCFLSAGREGLAAKDVETAAVWLEELDLVYHRTLLEFELAYRSARVPAMQRHGDKLKLMLKHGGDAAQPLLTWMDNAIRADQARAAQQAQGAQ